VITESPRVLRESKYELTDLAESLLEPVKDFMNWALKAHKKIRKRARPMIGTTKGGSGVHLLR
jgi:DNA-binding HxlR family transcriptional regulator